MANDPADRTDMRLIAADKVEGVSVYNPKGEKLGTVENIFIDKRSGQAEYATMAFGGLLGMGWSVSVAITTGVVSGMAMIYLLGLLLKGAHDLQSSGNITLDAALGATGEVYASIPAKGEGRGQIRLVLRDRLRIINAVSDDLPFPRSARVRVLAVNDDNTLTVTTA